MKFLRVIPICFFLLLASFSFSQQQYSVDGKNYSLFSEVEGTLTLLWNTIDGEYRYFVKKGNEITELKNSKVNGDYQEEYKASLRTLTADVSMEVSKLKLTKTDLTEFFNAYNKKVDANYVAKPQTGKLKTRLGGFIGYTNNAYFINPDNTFLPSFGFNLELIELERLKRHSVVAQFEQILSSSEYDFSSTQLSLNYRFKFIKSEKVDIYINTKFVSFIYVNRDVIVPGEGNAEDEVLAGTGSDIRAPGAFGLGADVALGNGYLTLALIDLVAVGLEQGDEFPLNAQIGYKFNL